MAALRDCLCQLFVRRPSRLFAVSTSSLQTFSSRRRFLQTSHILRDSNKLIITENCMKRLEEILDKDQLLRIIVEGGGCSGFQYKFEIDSKLEEDDRVFGEGKSRVVVDEESLKLIEGSSVDYETEMIKSAFSVKQNPNADKGCSCGASFSIKI
eukprot:gene20610-22644_t